MLAFLSKKSYPAPRRTTTRLTRSTTVEGPRIALPPSITQLTLILTSLADVAGCALVTFALVEVIGCLLYTSDAADEEDSVDLGGRRIIKKKKKKISINR